VINSLRASIDASIDPMVNEMLGALAQSKSIPCSVAGETWFTAARAYCWRGDIMNACAAMTKAVVLHPTFVTEIPWRIIRYLARALMYKRKYSEVEGTPPLPLLH